MLRAGDMDITVNCRLAAALADRLRQAREDLTRRWLDRIAARVAIDPNRIFPTDDLLDHVPLLIDGIADYLADPAVEISAEAPVIGKAIELGELRFSLGFAAHEILKEYEILGGVLFAFLVRTVDEIEEPCSRAELLACAHRLFRAISVIQQVTTTHYLRMVDERVREREERLRGFNRMVSHELKNHIGAVLGAAQLLGEEWIAENAEQREKFTRIIADNAEGMQAVLENLITLSRTDTELRRQRNVLLPEATAEAARQLREAAGVQGVEIRLAPDLPPIEVNAAAVELCLVNYLSNAIKYSDPAKPEKWVEVRGYLAGGEKGDEGCELIVEVRDNGIGIPEEARGKLFQRFFRAHEGTVTGVEGTGLGLSIVRETMEAIGGRAWVDFDVEEGASFAIALPCRRRRDAAAMQGEEAASG
ncbi:MAG: ATP-binding protein [Longimicrobiaceae bacterium]